jgi:amidase
MFTFAEYEHYDALGLAELVRTKQLTPLEVVEAAIARIEARNPQINAVIHTMFNQARQAAQNDLPDGPLRGVPFLVKDLLAMVAGAPMASGTRLLKTWAPAIDSELVRRWKAAGLVILGKTNTPEFGLQPYTEPATLWRDAQSLRSCAHRGRFQRRIGRSRGSAPHASSQRRRRRRLDPRAIRGEWRLWPQTNARAHTNRSGQLGTVGRLRCRACAHPLRARQRRAARRHRRRRYGAPYAAPPQVRPFLEEVGRDPRQTAHRLHHPRLDRCGRAARCGVRAGAAEYAQAAGSVRASRRGGCARGGQRGAGPCLPDDDLWPRLERHG